LEGEIITRELAETPGFIKHKKPAREPVRFISADTIEPLPVYWLWYPYVPMGMVTLISGDPGLGKSWMTMSIAADISAGRKLPEMRTALPPRKVLIMNYEDSPQHTIIPRLMALGANMANVRLPDRGFVLDADGIRLMEEEVSHANVGIVFIDPIVAAIGAGVDMNKANEVRSVMGALSEVAHRTGAAIIAVRHLRKSGRGDSGKAIYAGLGSIDFTAAVRSEVLVERAKDGTKVMRHIKCNVCPGEGPTLAFHYSSYETTDPKGEPVQSSRFEWLGLYEGEAYEVGSARPARKRDDAKLFLQDLLKEGPKPASEVVKAGELRGFNLKMLKRAKEGIAESVQHDGMWHWQLKRPAELDPRLIEEAQRRLAEAA